MKLHTTLLGKRNAEDWDNQLELDNLFPDDGAVRYVTILSAYTDIKMLNLIYKKSIKKADKRSGVRIRIFLDRLASTYVNDPAMKQRMDSLAKRLQKNGVEGSGIWLVKIGSLFHVKAAVIESNKSVICMVGSLNMTKKAFERNEELVLLGEADINSKASDSQIARWISTDYCKALEAQSEKVPFTSATTMRHESLQSLMLSGVMVHELKEADPFRFKIGLPEKFLEIRQTVHPLMRAELKDSISLESIITGRAAEDGLGYKLPEIGEDGTERWKKFCLDTCYGYWCPDSLRDDVQEAIDSKKNSRRPKFEGKKSKGVAEIPGLFAVIKDRENEITKCFHNILAKVDQQISEDHVTDENWDVKKVHDRWTAWYERLNAKIQNQDTRNRLVLGVVTAPVPNVWSDPITSDEFEHSLIESLQYAWSKGEVTRFTKIILKTLQNEYQLDADIIRTGSTIEILQHFEKRLRADLIEDGDEEEEEEVS